MRIRAAWEHSLSRTSRPLLFVLGIATVLFEPSCRPDFPSRSLLQTSSAPALHVGGPAAPVAGVLPLSAKANGLNLTLDSQLEVPVIETQSEIARADDSPAEDVALAAAPEGEAVAESSVYPVALAPSPAPSPALTALLPGVQRPYNVEIERWRPLVRQVLEEAKQEGRIWGAATALNDDLLLAMMEQESGGDPTAESWAGALGLLQLMPETYAELIHGNPALVDSISRDEIVDPVWNVRAGVRYMAWALQAHRGNLYWSVASYNAGVGATQSWRALGISAVPPLGGYMETAYYAPAILLNYAYHRPDAAVFIPAPISVEELPDIVALLEGAGLW
ncbi:MAG TPA: lytic transglycosylase domain-containing protein [Chloroflexota bacterium]|nr:lytic transglycosylase domain-containing protein [Chloroflexota bacterium]